MKEIALQALYTILGLNAASGIIYTEDKIFAISDQSNALYEYSIKNNRTQYHSLDGNTINHAQEKSVKYDSEGILLDQQNLMIVGSGSKPNRNLAFTYDLTNKTADTLSLSYLYETLSEFSEIPKTDFNVEGLVKYKEDYIFLNRGNGKNNINALMVVQGKNLTDEFNTFAYTFDLPKINNTQSGFSDGVVLNNNLYFIATAEGSDSTYNDGKIMGSMIGCIDLKKMKLKFTQIISENQKFEGITIKEIKGKEIEFLLSEDNDTVTDQSIIYSLKCKLKKKP